MCRSSCGGFIGMIYHYYRRTACSLFKPARGLNKEWIAVKTVPWFISCSICFLFIETSLFNCRLGSTSTTKRQSVTKAYFIQSDASYPRFPAYHYWVLGKENAWERSHFFSFLTKKWMSSCAQNWYMSVNIWLKKHRERADWKIGDVRACAWLVYLRLALVARKWAPFTRNRCSLC